MTTTKYSTWFFYLILLVCGPFIRANEQAYQTNNSCTPDFTIEPCGVDSQLQSVYESLTNNKERGFKDGSSGSVGPAWQSNLINALAVYVVRRAQQESQEVFINYLRNELKNADLQCLLQNTYALTETFDLTVGATSWSALKEALEMDFSRLPDRVAVRLLRNSSAADSTAAVTGIVAVQLIRLIENGATVRSALCGLRKAFPMNASVDRHDKVSELYYVLGTATQLASIAPTSTSWDSSAAAHVLIGDLENHRIDTDDLIDSMALARLLSGLRTVLKRIDAPLAKFPATTAVDSANREAAMDRLSTAFSSVTATIRDLTIVLNWNDSQSLILNRRLGGAQRFMDAVSYVRHQSYSKAFVAVCSGIHQYDTSAQLPGWLRKHGAFASELASAKSTDEMEQVLQSLTEPVGSYRAKRGDKARCTFVNAYFGIQGGRERLHSDTPVGQSDQAGVFVPIGIETSWGVGKSSSLGILVSVIDLGSLVSYRLESSERVHTSGGDTTTVDNEPAYTFAQVFSPGIYLTCGLHKATPITFGIGASLTPRLRDIHDQTQHLVETSTSFRYGVFLALDLPMLRL